MIRLEQIKNPHESRSIVSSVFFFVLLFGFTFFTGNTTRYGNIFCNEIFYNIALASLLLIFGLFVFTQSRLDFKYNKLDFIALILVFYIIFQSLILHPYWDDVMVAEILSFFIYFYTRFILQKRPEYSQLIIFLFLIALALHHLTGWYQIFHKISNPSSYAIEGVFVNSGPFSIYLASFLPFIVVLLNRKSKLKIEKITEQLAIWLLASSIILMLVTFSRTSWISALAGVSFCVLVIYSAQIKRKIERPSIKIIGSLFIIIALGVSGIFLYKIKKDSAFGRLLIWKVGSDVVKSSPIFGHGYGGFKKHYNFFQSKYFQSEERPKREIRVADQVLFVFNSFLNFVIEYGFFGFCLFTAFIFSAFSNVFRLGINRIKENWILLSALGGTITILISCFTSYPLEILPIKISFFFFLGIISSSIGTSRQISFSLDKKYRWVVYLMLSFGYVCLLFNTINSYNGRKDWEQAVKLYDNKEYRTSLREFSESYTAMKNNGYFLINYGRALATNRDYTSSNDILLQAENYLSDTSIYGRLADNYRVVRNYKDAEKRYLQQINVIPGRFTPRFELVNMYLEQGDSIKAKEMAKYIWEMEIKVESPIVDSIRQKMNKLLYKKENQ